MTNKGNILGVLDDQTFSCIIRYAPLVSIDLIVRDKKKDSVLLGLRRNRPAAGYWFVPGGRIRKNETLKHAFSRLTKDELGKEIDFYESKQLGVYEHFYTDCVYGKQCSTHYIVIAREVKVDNQDLNLPTDQHHKYRWFLYDELKNNKNVHFYTKAYFE